MNQESSFTWEHKDQNGKVIGKIKRIIGKDGIKRDLPFYEPNENNDFDSGTTKAMKRDGNPLFGLETIKNKQRTIVICEGQKAATAWHGLGYQCVTSILGANNANKANWNDLQGAIQVFLAPDNDDPGNKYINDVAKILQRFSSPPDVQVLSLPNLPPKGDICDWLKQQSELNCWDELSDLSQESGISNVIKKIKILIKNESVPFEENSKEWEELMPLQKRIAPSQPFPIDALGNVLGNLAKTMTEIIQAPLAICGQSVLAAATLTVQAHADITIDGRTNPLNAFFVSIAATGERKSAVDKVALNPLRDYQKRLGEQKEIALAEWKKKKECYDASKKQLLKKTDTFEEKQRAVALLGHLPPCPLDPLIIIEEPTYEGLVKMLVNGQPSIGLFSDEGGRFIGGHGMNAENKLKTISGLCGFWDGNSITRVRAGDGISELSGRRVSFHLMIQPRIAELLFSDSLLSEQGFLTRCLMVYPESTAGQRQYCENNIYSSESCAQYQKKLTEILRLSKPLAANSRNILEPRKLELSKQAKIVWILFHNTCEHQLKTGNRFALIRGFANKAPEHALRIAGTLTLIEDIAAKEIPIDRMSSAIQLTEFYLSEALRLFDSGHTDPVLTQAEELYQWLYEKKKLTISLIEIYQYGPKSIRNARLARDLMTILVEHGYACPFPLGIEFEGTHRKEAWGIRPKELEFC